MIDTRSTPITGVTLISIRRSLRPPVIIPISGSSSELDAARTRKFPCQNDAMEDIRIRPAGLADIDHILRQRRAMFRDTGRGTEAELDEMLVTGEAFLRAALPSGGYRGWLAETADGRIVAGAGITIVPWPGAPGDPAGRRGWIQNVYTEPEFRRRGLARRLLETVVEWCRADGFQTVWLHASRYGRSLYKSMGFRPTNEMRLKF